MNKGGAQENEKGKNHDRRTKAVHLLAAQKESQLYRYRRPLSNFQKHFPVAIGCDTEIENPKISPKINRDYNGFCKMCGVVWEAGKSKTRPDVFCTDECRQMWRRFNLDKMSYKSLKRIRCLACSKEFTCFPSQIKTFCSHSCYIHLRYHREDNH